MLPLEDFSSGEDERIPRLTESGTDASMVIDSLQRIFLQTGQNLYFIALGLPSLLHYLKTMKEIRAQGAGQVAMIDAVLQFEGLSTSLSQYCQRRM